MKSTKFLLLMIISTLLIVMVACGGEEEETVEVPIEEPEPEAEPEEIEETEPEPEPEPEEPVYANTFPLTGIGTDDEVGHRAFGVMIENSLAARPQSGLYQADVVYEVLSEGRITRQLAFFHSQQPDRIGPVRSARDYYIYLNNGYDAVYYSAGGSPDAFGLFQSGQVANISGLAYDGRYFERSPDRRAPHDLYTSYEGLVGAVEHRGYDTEGREPPVLPFVEEIDKDRYDGEAIEVNISYNSSYNNVRFEYDGEIGGYIRSVGGERVDDLETGDPVAPRNLFIVEATHRVIDDVGRRSINIESGGNAYLIHDGEVLKAEWQNIGGVILPYKNGEPLHFLPGMTWINFVETSGGGIENHVSFHE